MSAADTPRPFRIRDLGMSAYLPELLFCIGQGAVIPFTPLFAKDLGASVAVASMIVALRGFGTVLFDIPAGVIVGYIGERYTMLLGTILLAIVAALAGVSGSLALFAVLMVVMGFSWAIWQLARLTYVANQAPPEMRGRAMSIIGGANRVGNAVGPLLGGFLGARFGLGSAFYLQAGLAVIASALMFILLRCVDDLEEARGEGRISERFAGVMVSHRRVFATAGFATLCLSLVRAARQTVIPLWGDHIGLGIAAVGLVYSVSSTMDMVLFYPSGTAMDRLGRKAVGIPCLLLVSLGLILVPVSRTLIWFVGVALLTGFGNGLGAGVVMTLGADFSPIQNRAEFLGVWRMLSDAGQLGGPLMLGAVTSMATLGVASIATGGVGLLGALILWLLVPEPLKRRRTLQPEARSP